MWAFLTGAAAATVLVVATYFVLDFATVTAVEHTDEHAIIVDETPESSR